MARRLQDIRNLGIIAHIDAGKTTVTERMLFYTHAKHRVGEVDKGTTTTDFDPEEQQRGITIYSACVSMQWKDIFINLIDTPGHVDFTAEVERSLRVLDGAVVVFSAREGVEAQSETVWRQADRYHVPRVAFINKLDREGASFYGTIEQIRARLGANPVPVSIPLGSGPPHQSDPFRGVIDLVEMQLLTFTPESQGAEVTAGPIPPEAEALAHEWRRKLLDELFNYNDELAALVLEEAPVPPDLIRQVLRSATLAYRVTPILCGSALDFIGIQPLLDAVKYYLPSPAEVPPVVGRVPEKKGKKKIDAETELVEEQRKPDPSEPFCGLVFKVLPEKHGDLVFVRVYSGKLSANSRMLNPRLDEKENISQLWRVQADRREQIPSVEAGDIVGVIGIRHSVTGDTICEPKAPIVLESITFPETVIAMAIEPDSTAERKKLAEVLEMLKRQDPTFRALPSEETGQTIISGMGELHLEIIKNRLLRDFNLKVRVHKPRVSYRETVARAVEVQGICDRHVGGQELYAAVKIRVEPFVDPVKPIVIENRLTGPFAEQFGEVVMEVLSDRIQGSGLAGFPLMRVKLTALALEVREENVNEIALRHAAADAVEKALHEAGPVLLEPIMKLEVNVPEEYVGNIAGDLQQRRAIITGQHSRSGVQVVEAEVPLAMMFGYSSAMRSLSQGRASCSMEPRDYAEAPADVRDQFLGMLG